MVMEQRVASKDLILPYRVADSISLASPLPLGGVGWRPGVPHIVIQAGDTTGVCPFPVGYEVPEFIPPASDRGLEVPVAFMRCEPGDWRLGNYWEWVYDESGVGEAVPAEDWPNGRWTTLDLELPDPTVRYLRSGPVGDFLVCPSNGATLPGTLDALADLDIAVVTLTPYGVKSVGQLPLYRSRNELTYDSLMWLYENSPNHLVSSYLSPPDSLLLPDQWGGGPINSLHTTGAGLAFLTGAVIEDPESLDPNGTEVGMSYMWAGDPRFAQPSDTNASEFVDFLAPRILDLAESLGSRTSFDIAMQVDNSGSFGSSDGVAVQVFRDLIGRLRDENLDIFVAMSRYSEYSYWHFPYAGAGMDDRPYILQWPVSSIAAAEDYDAMLEILEDTPPGDGGDLPETNWEGLYQIAVGTGLDGSVDRTEMSEVPDDDITDSGLSTDRGAPVEFLDNDGIPQVGLEDYLRSLGWSESEITLAVTSEGQGVPHLSRGLGYMMPAWSGDVPSFAGQNPIRGTGLVGPEEKRVRAYNQAL